MKNIPRLFINQPLKVNSNIFITNEQYHYLTRVMRTNNCFIFNEGFEYLAEIKTKNELHITKKTNNKEINKNIILYFAPIKKISDLINMATQLGVNVFQPVITERTNIFSININRLNKIIYEACEQSNRCLVPSLKEPIKFSDFDKKNVIFGDERHKDNSKQIKEKTKFLIGAEGGFSDREFDILEKEGGIGVDLGHNILRAETATIALLSKIIL